MIKTSASHQFERYAAALASSLDVRRIFRHYTNKIAEDPFGISRNDYRSIEKSVDSSPQASTSKLT